MPTARPGTPADVPLHEFTYDALPGRVIFGIGAIERVPAEVVLLGAERVLLIAGEHEREVAGRLARSLGRRLVGTLDDVRAHVPSDLAASARGTAGELGADLLITLGGGSTTGLGKAIALERGTPILAIPTTYAGSEMTPIWGLTEANRKTTGRDMRVLPRVVVYDPILTLSLPPRLSAASGMNAMAHCVEAGYAEGGSPVVRAMALEGICALAGALPAVLDHPGDIEVRSELLYAAYLAGSSLAAAGSGLHHKICHVLGGAFDLPHAETHALILPHAVAFNAPAMPEAMDRIARALGVDDPAAGLFDLDVALGLPTRLAEIGMREADLDEAATLIADHVQDNPRPVDAPSIRRLLDDAAAGRRPTVKPATGGPAPTTPDDPGRPTQRIPQATHVGPP
jgi:maleylacetate reductase